MDDVKLLNVTEVASKIGVSIPTVYRFVRAGTFPKPLAVGPQARRWRSDEVEAHLDELTAARDCAA